MKIVPNKTSQVKKSSLAVSSEMLKSLKDAEEVGGTVTYVFLEDRIKNTKEGVSELYQTKTVQKAAINPEIFYKVIEGKKIKRSTHEILQIFEDTKWDLGASEFIIN